MEKPFLVLCWGHVVCPLRPLNQAGYRIIELQCHHQITNRASSTINNMARPFLKHIENCFLITFVPKHMGLLTRRHKCLSKH